MKPDQRWFPTSRWQRAGWFANFATNFTEVGPTLGFTQDEVDSVNADNEMMQYIASVVLRTEAYLSAVRSFEHSVTGGSIGSNQPEFPAVNLPSMPAAVPPGLYERLEKLVRRIRVAPKYSPSIGALLGIIPNNRSVANIAEFTPKLTVRANAFPHSIRVRCPRGKFRAFEISILRAGQTVWEQAAFLTSSPANIDIKPTTPGMPEKISVRARMRDGQEGVGRFSNIVEVTLNA